MQINDDDDEERTAYENRALCSSAGCGPAPGVLVRGGERRSGSRGKGRGASRVAGASRFGVRNGPSVRTAAARADGQEDIFFGKDAEPLPNGSTLGSM